MRVRNALRIGQWRRNRGRGAVMVSAVFLLLGSTVDAAGASGIVPPHDPASNVAATPAYNTVASQMYQVGSALPPCWRWQANKIVANPGNLECVRAETQATNHAHR